LILFDCKSAPNVFSSHGLFARSLSTGRDDKTKRETWAEVLRARVCSLAEEANVPLEALAPRALELSPQTKTRGALTYGLVRNRAPLAVIRGYSREPAATGMDLAGPLFSATYLRRLARNAMYSLASLVRRCRSCELNMALRTMRQITRGRKKYSP